MSGGGYSQRRVRPPKPGEVVDLGAKFGVAVGSDSDSSDAEFAPEDEEQDSEDSRDSSDEGEEESEGGEEGEEEGEESVKEKEEEEESKPGPLEAEGEGEAMEVETKAEKASEKQGAEGEGVSSEGGSGDGVVDKDKINPLLITRRSQRVIKPTKDIDLYLLSAQFGVSLEDSEGEESSDMEFAPAEESDADSLSDVSSISGEGEEGEGRKGGEGRKEGEGRKGEQTSTDMQVQSDDQDDASRSVSEFSVMQEVPQTKTIEIPLCCVCLEDSMGDEDIVSCDHCGISVHEGCYGVPEDDGVDDSRSDLSSFTTVPWFCDPCKAGISPIACSCELCPNSGGLFKQTVNGRWVHVVCSLYTPGIEYVEPDLLSGVTLETLAAAKWGAKACQLCDDEGFSKTGVCIGCDAGMCKSFFHVTCAQQHGLLCEVDNDDKDRDLVDPYFAHCKAHCDKDIAKRKRRDYLTAMSKQKKFKFDDTDDRIQHHLDEMRKEYLAFFRKMQRYYQPENSCKPEERLLHNMPSAFRRLTQKAQLLGYITETSGTHTGEVRRKIAPKLTCEFVNYFTERHSRIRAREEQQEGLKTTNSDLKKEELEVKLRLAQVERELKSLRVHGHELKCQATAIYTNITRITEKDLPMPDFLGEGEEKEEQKDDKDLPTCSICKQSRDAHMMALCDTCNKRYHINCLKPPLPKVPKKSAKWGWQCHECCFSSGDELVPTMADWDEPASRCGRKIQPPKVFFYPEDQVKSKKKSKSKSKSKK